MVHRTWLGSPEAPAIQTTCMEWARLLSRSIAYGILRCAMAAPPPCPTPGLGSDRNPGATIDCVLLAMQIRIALAGGLWQHGAAADASSRSRPKQARKSGTKLDIKGLRMASSSRFGNLVDTAIYCVCTIGLVGCAALAVYGLLPLPTPPSDFTALITKIFILPLMPTGFVFVLRYRQLTQDRTQRDIEKNMYSGCPRWMRTGAYALMATGVTVFFLPAILDALGLIAHIEEQSTNVRVIGGFGLMAFPALIAQLYSANASFRKPDVALGNTVAQ
jgi:hypothetical protein